MENMTENAALSLLRRGDEAGLRWMIQQYASYVGAIVRGIAGSRLSRQDIEEIVADVFMVLWRNRTKPMDGKAKSYLASIARSRARNGLRKLCTEQPLDYDSLELPAEGPEGELLIREGKRQVRELLNAMGPSDREIFLRHYYLGETAGDIGSRMGMTPEAVRQRLKRGRDQLRRQLEKGDKR